MRYCLTLFALAISALAQTAFPPAPCATDPTYQYFEILQKDAYTEGAVPLSLLRNVLESNASIRASMEEMARDLAARRGQSSLDLPAVLQGPELEKIIQSVATFELHTCYENRLVLYAITEQAGRIEKAALELSLPISHRPKLGSLPVPDLNALTYPAKEGRDSIVAFNEQLWDSASALAKLFLSTIGPPPSDISEEHAMATINTPSFKRQYISKILELQLLSERPRISSVPEDDARIGSLIDGMELFAIGHEYGHVIKNHQSAAKKVALGFAGNCESKIANVDVLERSWQQELEADQIGVQLLIQALRNEHVVGGPFALKGALLFFKYLEIGIRVKGIVETGHPPAEPSLRERVFLRAVADGKASLQDAATFGATRFQDHPPPWLRLERASAAINAYLVREHKFDNLTGQPEALIRNVDLAWRAVLPELIESIQTAKRQNANAAKAKCAVSEAPSSSPAPPEEPETGCVVSTAFWEKSFLCSPAMQKAVVAFEESNGANEAEIQAAYFDALKEDWFLLSGLQAFWAVDVLDGKTTGDRRHALAVLALSANTGSVLKFLSEVDASSWPERDRLVLTSAKQFLGGHGRSPSIVSLKAPESMDAVDVLWFPMSLDSQTVRSLVPGRPFDPDLAFLEGEGSKDASAFALSLVGSHISVAKEDARMAQFFMQHKQPVPGVAYARAAIAHGDSSPYLKTIIGIALVPRGGLGEANRDLEATTSSAQDKSWEELDKARAYRDSGEIDDAERWFRRGLADMPSDLSAPERGAILNEFAEFLIKYRRADRERAGEALKLSLQSNRLLGELFPHALDVLAECQAVNGDFAAAVEAEKKALKVVDSEKDAAYLIRRLRAFEAKLKEQKK